jgi:hypothetical protein
MSPRHVTEHHQNEEDSEVAAQKQVISQSKKHKDEIRSVYGSMMLGRKNESAAGGSMTSRPRQLLPDDSSKGGTRFQGSHELDEGEAGADGEKSKQKLMRYLNLHKLYPRGATREGVNPHQGGVASLMTTPRGRNTPPPLRSTFTIMSLNQIERHTSKPFIEELRAKFSGVLQSNRILATPIAHRAYLDTRLSIQKSPTLPSIGRAVIATPNPPTPHIHSVNHDPHNLFVKRFSVSSRVSGK